MIFASMEKYGILMSLRSSYSTRPSLLVPPHLLGFANGVRFPPQNAESLKVVHTSVTDGAENVQSNLSPLVDPSAKQYPPVSELWVHGLVFGEFLLPVGEVAPVPERAVTLHVVFAHGNLEEVALPGCGPSEGDSFLASLHLAQTKGVITHQRSVYTVPSCVLVPAESAVDAETLLVEDALHPVLLLDVPERAVWGLALVTVTAEGHLLEVELVEELAPFPLHAESLHPVPAHYSPQPGVVPGACGAVCILVGGGTGDWTTKLVEEDGLGLLVGKRILNFRDCLGGGGGGGLSFSYLEKL